MKVLMGLKINKLPIVITKQADGYFVAESPVLELATQGKTLQQTRDRFAELVVIFFEELVDMGTVDEVLESLGWVKQNKQWNPPVLVETS